MISAMPTISLEMQRMASESEFADLLRRCEEDSAVVVLVESLFRRRAELRRAAGNATGATADAAIADVLAGYEYSRSAFEFASLDPSASEFKDIPRWSAFESAEAVARLYEEGRVLDAPAIRALLLQALWDLKALWQKTSSAGVPKPFEILKEAVAAHVQAARWWATRDDLEPSLRGLQISKHWTTAVRLARDVSNVGLLSGALASLRAHESALRADAPHWSLALLSQELHLAEAEKDRPRQLVGDGRLNNISTLLEDVRGRVVALRHMEHVEDEWLDVWRRAETLLGRPPDQKTLAEKRARMLEEQARRQEAWLAKHGHLRVAAEQFHQAGMRAEAAAAKAAAREVVREAELAGGFKAVTTKVQVTAEQLSRMTNPFFDGATSGIDVSRRMGRRFFAPSLEGHGAAPRPRSLASELMMTVPLVGDRSMKPIEPGTPEAEVFHKRMDLLREIEMSSAIVIDALLDRLSREKPLSSADLLVLWAEGPGFAEDDRPFLERAASHYLAGDSISFVHVLVPRLEQWIRRIADAMGIDVTALKDGEMRERPLGELLRALEDAGAFPAELVRLFQATLAEPWGWNLRNHIAHGLVTQNECAPWRAGRVLQLSFVLAQLNLVEEAPEPKDEAAPATGA
jgi:hypothetical protein